MLDQHQRIDGPVLRRRVQLVAELLDLGEAAAAQAEAGGVEGDDTGALVVERPLGGPEFGDEVVDPATHHLVVARYVVPGQRVAELLREDAAGEGQVRGRSLVDEVAVDDEEVRARRLDLAQGAPGLGDDRAVRVAGDELGVGHHREPPVPAPGHGRRVDQRVGRGGLSGQLDGGRDLGGEVVDHDPARVLLVRRGLREVEAGHRERHGGSHAARRR